MEFRQKPSHTHEFDGKQQVHNICITKTLFWVRMHNLPLMARNEYIERLIGKTLEKVEEVDLESGE